jgi:ribosomal protein L11 methyltransferase
MPRPEPLLVTSMKPRDLWRVSVTTSPQAEDAVTELLASTFDLQPVSYTDLARGTTTVTVFSPHKPAWSRARQLWFKDTLRQLELCGLDIGPARVRLARLSRENWAESWRRHFRPMVIRSRLLIKPNWSRRRATKKQFTVVLNPGLSFGTGQHPTTRFCLEQIVTWRQPRTVQSFLDLGTGSGILAIAAAKLGYSPVHALDCDPDAIRSARANIQLNHISRQVRLLETDLSRLPRRFRQRYSLICANLISDLLFTCRDRIIARLEPNGLLVLAGILDNEFEEVLQKYTKRGMRLISSRSEAEWRSGIFCRNGKTARTSNGREDFKHKPLLFNG